MLKTPYIFFTGKGGVGKTTIACATAIQMAETGKKVLLVCTDPASNLEDVLESPVTNFVQPVRNVQGLFVVNIDPVETAEKYRNRATSALQGILPEAEIHKIKEQLSGACTTEIAAFDEFSRFVSGEFDNEKYDIVIFDTAPTGHTLRLLELPSAWSSFTENNPDGASCLGPSSALKNSSERYKTVVSRLRDANQTTVVIVARPETATLKEAARASKELFVLGLRQQELFINGVFKANDKNDKLAQQIESRSVEQLKNIPDELKSLPLSTFPLLPYNILGITKLRSIYDQHLQNTLSASAQVHHKVNHELKKLNQLVETIISEQQSGLIMTMGKGGVGKTITASAIAVLLAQKGFEVHLTTTDPAAHINDFIKQLDNIPDNLIVDNINPKIETQHYIDKIMSQKGKNLSENDRLLLLEDLKSPCTEEVAVFHAFSKAIQESKRKFVLIDTAPTGHTLLLLDTAGTYHREIMRNTSMNENRITTPYMTLKDENKSKILLVALPETTPMHEAAALQEDLKRAGIKPYAWIINQCLTLHENITDPLLISRAGAEVGIIEHIENHLADKVFGIPFLAEKNLLPTLLNQIQD